ncbi:transposase [Crossiella sp. S99.2]|uniref:transposase n=1 Tax=unclassified Crossiella TaxID=2620835 RepID=UPI0035ABC33A
MSDRTCGEVGVRARRLPRSRGGVDGAAAVGGLGDDHAVGSTTPPTRVRPALTQRCPPPGSPASAGLCSPGVRTSSLTRPSRGVQPTECHNLKIKNLKRTARGFHTFANYRLRLLLNHGRIHQDHLTSRIRTRRPSLVT